MRHSIHFYDAATPENVPSGVYAAVYVNGYAWPEDQIRRMARVFRISVHPEARWARYARCIDVESGAAAASDVVPFLTYRRDLGFRDATVYCNRSNYDAIRADVRANGLSALYWVSTLDDTTDVPGAWAVQYEGGPNARFDVSILHGVDNFGRTH